MVLAVYVLSFVFPLRSRLIRTPRRRRLAPLLIFVLMATHFPLLPLRKPVVVLLFTRLRLCDPFSCFSSTPLCTAQSF
jgi:hypothetical protein